MESERIIIPLADVDTIRKGNCGYCKHMKAALWWVCTNDEAKADRGTNQPGVDNCPHWDQADIETPYMMPLVKTSWVSRLFS